MSDYIPDPIELMEMQAERMIDKHMPANQPGMFLCAACNRWLHESVGMASATSNPASPPICLPCFDIFSKGCGP